MKFLFSLLAGSVFAVLTVLLVGIYWLFGLLARIVSVVLLPLRRH